ncbi:hypothetical protein OROMI_008977 [Orobanche minor]
MLILQITEQIYVGSCIHTEADVETLANVLGEDVYLVRAIHKGGSKFEADIKLSHGRYCYEYVINGNWRHSTSSPTVIDEHGNVNNVIVVGDVASDSAVVKVIERISTEVEPKQLDVLHSPHVQLGVSNGSVPVNRTKIFG